MNIPFQAWLGIGFLLLGLERFVPGIPPWLAGIVFLVLGILILIAI